MSYYQVSEENMAKVEAFFVEKVKQVGDNRFEATVVDIADGSGVALATAHKAIKQLAQEKKITIIKPSSRRFPITYVYNSDIEGYDVKVNTEEQIEYLQNMVKQLQESNELLQKQYQEQVGENNILLNRLMQSNGGV